MCKEEGSIATFEEDSTRTRIHHEWDSLLFSIDENCLFKQLMLGWAVIKDRRREYLLFSMDAKRGWYFMSVGVLFAHLHGWSIRFIRFGIMHLRSKLPPELLVSIDYQLLSIPFVCLHTTVQFPVKVSTNTDTSITFFFNQTAIFSISFHRPEYLTLYLSSNTSTFHPIFQTPSSTSSTPAFAITFIWENAVMVGLWTQ